MLSESFLPFFQWCEHTWLGTIVRDTVWAFPVIETFHLLALAATFAIVIRGSGALSIDRLLTRRRMGGVIRTSTPQFQRSA